MLAAGFVSGMLALLTGSYARIICGKTSGVSIWPFSLLIEEMTVE
jgi:hypothetical protein